MKILYGLKTTKSNLQLLEKLHVSTKYSLRDSIEGSIKEKLEFLRRSINTEIAIHRPFLLSLEELGERYHEDGSMAYKDCEFGFFGLYTRAEEQVKFITEHCYRCLGEVI